jgi:hypothetical protein
MDNTETIPYVDARADKIQNFKILAQLMWNKAYLLLKTGSDRSINVIDPQMGGGRLLSMMRQKDEATGYEKDYELFTHAKALEQIQDDFKLVNEPFEFRFAKACLPSFDLAICVPCEQPITSEYEKDAECLKFKSYSLYLLARSMDALFDGGIAVFAIPVSHLEDEAYLEDRKRLLKKSYIIVSEKYENFAIIAATKKQ